MAGDGRGHAQPRVGVDVGAADEAFHQLVGDVVVLGEELPGAIERHRVRSALGDGSCENGGDAIERFIPAGTSPLNLWDEQAPIARKCFAERRAFRAEAAVVGGMIGITRDTGVSSDAQPAAHAAIGARGADHAACHRNSAAVSPALASGTAAVSASRRAAIARSAKVRPKTS
jgi:hypothetical protein